MNRITEAKVGVSIRTYVKPEWGDTSAPTALRTVHELAERAASGALALDGRLVAIEADPHLSKEGKSIKRRDEAAAALDALRLDSAGSTARKAVEDRVGRIFGVVAPEPTQDANEIALAGEIRRHVAGLAPLERERWLSEHAADPKVAAAVLNGPAFLSGLDSQAAERFRMNVVHKQRPDLAAELEVLQRARDAADRIVVNTESLFAERAKMRKTDDGWVPAPNTYAVTR